jgi:signal peptidase II
MKNKTILAVSLVLLVLLIDQAVKIYVKTHFLLGEEVKIFGWERGLIHFVENPGMAFGMEFGGDYGKLALSLFRIVAVSFLVFYIRILIKNNYSKGLIASFSLILAGAMGNIIDSAFYGMIFSASVPEFHGGDVARLFPPEGGYESFLHGRVVDMFYFPLYEGTFPAWMASLDNYTPSWFMKFTGQTFAFFRPVFNVADASITIGVASLILFQRSYFNESNETKQEPTSKEEVSENDETMLA